MEPRRSYLVSSCLVVGWSMAGTLGLALFYAACRFVLDWLFPLDEGALVTILGAEALGLKDSQFLAFAISVVAMAVVTQLVWPKRDGKSVTAGDAPFKDSVLTRLPLLSSALVSMLLGFSIALELTTDFRDYGNFVMKGEGIFLFSYSVGCAIFAMHLVEARRHS